MRSTETVRFESSFYSSSFSVSRFATPKGLNFRLGNRDPFGQSGTLLAEIVLDMQG